MTRKKIPTDYESNENFKEKIEKTVHKGIRVVSLSFIVGIATISFITYTLVLNTENNLLKLHKKTATIQTQNVDLRTKVEFARSIYNVESKAASLAYLHRPDKVIEVTGNTTISTINIDTTQTPKRERILGGY